MKELTIAKWLEKTRWNFKGWKAKPAEVQARKETRERVLAAAGVTIGTLNNAKSRGVFTEALIARMAAATENEPNGFRIAPPKSSAPQEPEAN